MTKMVGQLPMSATIVLVVVRSMMRPINRLMSVAHSLAYTLESEHRRVVNSDPDGDGYDLGGYENGMNVHDWFRCNVDDRAYDMAEKLAALILPGSEVSDCLE